MWGSVAVGATVVSTVGMSSSLYVAYLCFICASPRSTASTHSYKMKYQEYKGLYYNAWSTNNIVFYNSIRHKPQTYYNSRKWLSKISSSLLFCKLRRQMCWTKTHDRSAAIFNLHSSHLQHDMLQPRRVNTLNVLVNVTLVDSMAPTRICFLARWSLTLQKQAFPNFVKTQVFLSKILIRSTFSTQVYPSSFNLEKLGWRDSWTASTSCHSELSVTGDMAKYLVLNTL
jgi:hypothetical protein